MAAWREVESEKGMVERGIEAKQIDKEVKRKKRERERERERERRSGELMMREERDNIIKN